MSFLSIQSCIIGRVFILLSLSSSSSSSWLGTSYTHLPVSFFQVVRDRPSDYDSLRIKAFSVDFRGTLIFQIQCTLSLKKLNVYNR